MVDTGPGPKNGERERTRRPRFPPPQIFLTSTGAMTWPRWWYVTQCLLAKLTAVGRWRTVRCWSYAYGLSGFDEMRAKLDRVVFASASNFFPLVPDPCFIIGYTRSSLQVQALPWCHAIGRRLGGRGALPPGTWTLKGALTGTVVAVPGVGAFIADTEASRTLTSEGNVTGRTSSTHSLSSPSLCRGTAPDPQEHGSTSHQKS